MNLLGHARAESANWYVVRCQPKKEQLAKLHLCNQGFEIYQPLGDQVAHQRRHSTTVSLRQPAPLFPSYLFIKLNLGTMRWRAVNSTIGVLGLVQFGDLPARLPSGVVEALKARTSTPRPPQIPDDTLACGTPVRIIEGPFSGFISEVERSLPAERVVILLKLMTRQVEVVLPRQHVAKVA